MADTIRRLALTTALTLGLALTLTPSAHAGEVLDRVKESGKLTGASSDGFPPVAFLNENNEFDGFDVEVLEEIATRMGVEAAIVTPSWEAQTNGNWQGRWDIVVGSMFPTKERAEILDFPAIYYYTPAAFAVHEDSDVQAPEDLDGATIGVCGACSYELYLRRDLTMDAIGVPPFEYVVEPGTLTTYENDGLALDDLRLGDGVRLDAIFTNVPTLLEAIERGYPIRVVEPPLLYEPLAVAVEKGDDEFTAEVGRIVDEMHEDGTLTALSEKWFGVDLTKAPEAKG